VNIDIAPGETQTCILDILDTAGQEEYSALRDQYLRTGQGFLLVYSITHRKSFDEIVTLRDHILRAKDKDYNDYSVPIVLVGNKCDLEKERQVSKLEGDELAKSFHCPFFESSAKLRVNVDESFFQLVRQIRKEQDTSSTTKEKKKSKFCKVL